MSSRFDNLLQADLNSFEPGLQDAVESISFDLMASLGHT